MQATGGSDRMHAVPRLNVRAVLARRGFRRLLATRLSSQLGDGLFQASLVGNVVFNPENAATPATIAGAFALLLLPYSVLGPFVGVFLDRWSRRQVLITTSTIRATFVLPSAWLVGQGHDGPVLVGCALAVIALNRLFLAGISAAQPHVVDEPRLITANSLATTLGSATYSGGLVLAALAFYLTGAGSVRYGTVAATATVWYGLSALLTVVSFRVTALGPSESAISHGPLASALAHTVGGMVSGLRHLAARPAASSVVIVQAVHRGFFGILSISTLLLYRSYYYPTADPVGSMTGLVPVVGATTAGALLAALITPAIARRYGGWRWITALMIMLAGLVPGLGLPFHPWLTSAAAGAVSVTTQGVKIVSDTTIQVRCDDDFRGRVFSVNDTAMNLLFVAGLFVGAISLPANGRSRGILVALGIGYALVATWFATVSARLDLRSV